MLRNKSHLVISVIATNVFYSIWYLLKQNLLAVSVSVVCLGA